MYSIVLSLLIKLTEIKVFFEIFLKTSKRNITRIYIYVQDHITAGINLIEFTVSGFFPLQKPRSLKNIDDKTFL